MLVSNARVRVRVQICPDYLNPDDFIAGRSSFETVIEFGTKGDGMNKNLSTKLINKRLKK